MQDENKGIRDSGVALHSVEQNIKAGADVDGRGAALSVERVYYAEHRFHAAARNASLERAGCDVHDGCSGSL